MARILLCSLFMAFFVVDRGQSLNIPRAKRDVPCGKMTCRSGDFCLKEKCLTSCGGTLCVVGIEDCNSGKCVPKPKLQNEACGSKKCAMGDRCVDGKCRFSCGGNLCYTDEDYCDSEICVSYPVCGHGARLVGRKCMIDCTNDTCEADTHHCNPAGKCEEKFDNSCATFICPSFTFCQMRNGRPFCAWMKQ